MTEITVPVNIYRGLRRLMVATRLPGLEPQNKHEWTVGPYQGKDLQPV